MIKPRERSAILKSLAAGVVPKIGLHHIQVGREKELKALISDLENVENGGATVRFTIGRFGSGKSFFLNLIRTVALKRNFVILQADITIERRLHGTGGHARALYTELIRNMSTKANPEGNALLGLVEKFVLNLYNEIGESSDFEYVEKTAKDKLKPMLDLTHGINFVRVLSRYVEGVSTHNDELIASSIRWLRGEYGTKTEARQDLGVRDIIEDGHLYDMFKLWACFVRLVGYRGLFVNMDEMVVLSERLNNRQSRVKNYEVILQILNDCLQGSVEGIGFCFAGTEEFLSDKRRGLFSYEALETRLADNPFATTGIVDTLGPVIRLQSLSPEDLFVLLDRITQVHASGGTNIVITPENIKSFMKYCQNRLGADYFLTPRDAVKQYVGLLNVLSENPHLTIDDLLKTTEPAQSHDSTTEPEGLLKFKL